MNKVMSLLFVIMLLMGCSDDNEVITKPKTIEVEEKEVELVTEKEPELVIEQVKKEVPIDKFWEVYKGREIYDAVSNEEKVYDFEKEAGPFEDALLESFTKKEDKDWTPYLASFTANINGQASEEYIKTMNVAYIAVLDGDLDLAIEHIKEAKIIREESK